MNIQIQRIFCYNGFCDFLPVLVWFDCEYGRVGINLGSQSGWRPNEDMKMSSASFGARSLILVVVAQGLKKHVFWLPRQVAYYRVLQIPA